eukprot:2662636-Pyramimonas_sp.AAC.1
MDCKAAQRARCSAALSVSQQHPTKLTDCTEAHRAKCSAALSVSWPHPVKLTDAHRANRAGCSTALSARHTMRNWRSAKRRTAPGAPRP